MDMNTHNQYLFKALDCYPYELGEAVEALNYALSYEPENTQALFLMGKIYSNQLREPKTALHYFEEILSIDLEMHRVYPDYLYALLSLEEYEAAQRFLSFALTVKGSDKAQLRLIQGQLMEHLGQYKAARKALKLALQLGLNNDFRRFVKSELDRIKEKATSSTKKKGRKTKKKKKK